MRRTTPSPGVHRDCARRGRTGVGRQKAQEYRRPLPPVAAPAAPERVTTVEGITEYRLANGLRVLLFPDPSKPTITVNMTYLVGSRHENYGETGMAHLLEHMVFKGTPRHSDIPEELTAHGRAPQRHHLLDRTNYFETFARHRREPALGARPGSRPHGQLLHREEGSRQRDDRGAQRIRRGREQPDRRAVQAHAVHRLRLAQLRQHTIGARSDIENVPIEHLQAFYRKYYQPDNAVLMVAGKFDEAATLAMVNGYFGAIPRPTRVLPRLTPSSPRRMASGASCCVAWATSRWWSSAITRRRVRTKTSPRCSCWTGAG